MTTKTKTIELKQNTDYFVTNSVTSLDFSISDRRDYSVIFHQNVEGAPQEVGRLFVNEVGQIDFEGDLSKAARLFVDEVQRILDENRS